MTFFHFIHFAVFLPVLGCLYLLVFCAASFGFLISAISPSPEVALILAPVLVLPFMLLGGLFSNQSEIPVFSFAFLPYE
jgi:hypothetical protein